MVAVTTTTQVNQTLLNITDDGSITNKEAKGDDETKNLFVLIPSRCLLAGCS